MATVHQEQIILETNFSSLKLINRGKVRDLYDLGDSLLLVTTDRLSAYDVVMSQGIPYKGKVLNKISEFWFEKTKDIIPNHVMSTIVYDFPSSCKPFWREMENRTLMAKKSKPLPVECVVRGYLSGSGWDEYQESGSVCGTKLPEGLLESSRLAEPIFTPATKEEQGKHDENITFERMTGIIGRELAEKVRDVSLKIYKRAVEIAEPKGIIIADTKMEFGLNENGDLILIDELLTPDSSRFWPKAKYEPGRGQESFDKQFVRNYLVSIKFNKKPPAPKLPEDVILKTSGLYLQALEKLTGQRLM